MSNRCTLILVFQFILTLTIATFIGAAIFAGRLDPAVGLAIVGPLIAIWLPSPMVDNHLDHLVQASLAGFTAAPAAVAAAAATTAAAVDIATHVAPIVVAQPASGAERDPGASGTGLSHG